MAWYQEERDEQVKRQKYEGHKATDMCQKNLAIDEMFRDQKVYTNIAGTLEKDWYDAEEGHLEKIDQLKNHMSY